MRNELGRWLIRGFALWLAGIPAWSMAAESLAVDALPEALRVVLAETQPLTHPRGGRLPLWVLPISHSLAKVPTSQAKVALRELNRRGIGYSVNWNPGDTNASIAEALRMARMQQELGMEVVADATACLSSFFDGTDAMLHVDDAGSVFAETSFGGKLGCPFALEPRVPVMRERVEPFVRAYREAGLPLDLVFADWEVDGPIEWNDAWASSKRCRRCRENLPAIGDFRAFQKRLREIRSSLQRRALSDPVLAAYPRSLVGNYGVYPNDGYRYWYDYFERESPDDPARIDQRARYREWAQEFGPCGFTFAMPVVYTWYPIFGWYNFADPDYRWAYNLLLNGSNAGRHTPDAVPLIPFVHWSTTAPPSQPDPAVRQFEATAYQEVLWHLLLRGHDTFFLWCLPEELRSEIRLLHPVYAESLAHREFLEHGKPIGFEVPAAPGPVVSGLRWKEKVLVRRTDFGALDAGAGTGLEVALADGGRVRVPAVHGLQVLDVQPPPPVTGFLGNPNDRKFPLGFYELPAADAGLREMAEAGVNLVHCASREDLDRVQAFGLRGWVSVPIQAGDDAGLRAQVAKVADHPALAVWEGPDEIVWNFTAFSGLKETAGITRDDWDRQLPKAVAYAEAESTRLLPLVREGARLVRQLDPLRRPLWINEAVDSDAQYARRCQEPIDITGCDYYPVRSTGTDLNGLGRATERWRDIGQGKPVWMVLQGFSWHALKPERTRLYPSFEASRYMAYEAIAKGARGLFFWGTWLIDDPEYRRSIYALTSELASFNAFLVGESVAKVAARSIPELFEKADQGVSVFARRSENELFVVLINEEPVARSAVEVTGLDDWNERNLFLAFGSQHESVKAGALLTRLGGNEVKVFSTRRTAMGFDKRPRSYGTRR